MSNTFMIIEKSCGKKKSLNNIFAEYHNGKTCNKKCATAGR